MAIRVQTGAPRQLLQAIYEAIKGDHVDTWTYDGDGDFTHSVQQWKYKAWLHPSLHDGELRLTMISRKDLSVSTEVYAIYHGRFIEMLLAHFDKSFQVAVATAIGSLGDKLS